MELQCKHLDGGSLKYYATVYAGEALKKRNSGWCVSEWVDTNYENVHILQLFMFVFASIGILSKRPLSP